jgi:CRISP-associated protein Cas1
MFFLRKTKCKSTVDVYDDKPTITQHSTARTAYLIGPGCVRVEGDVPTWIPVVGNRTKLHFQYLQSVVCFGNVDFTTACLTRLWSHSIHVSFLSSSGHRALGILEPMERTTQRIRWQYLAASDAETRLRIAKETVVLKIDATIATARYFQQQGKKGSFGTALESFRQWLPKIQIARDLNSLRGIEGSVARSWFEVYRELVGPEWEFDVRAAHPPKGPLNAILSLGYVMATSRCRQLAFAAGFDPRIGFLHADRSGRDSLACDLVEPLRTAMVDRMVLALIGRRQLTPDSFDRTGEVCRLKDDAMRSFVSIFEKQFQESSTSLPSAREQIQMRLDSIATDLEKQYGTIGKDKS